MKLELRDINKSYGEKKALNHINMVLSEGIYGILGPNGAGKTTLINILTGNTAADSGVALFDGKLIRAGSADYFAELGYVPQAMSLYPGFSVLDYLLYMCALKNLPKSECLRAAETALSYVHLSDRAKDKIAHLSGGMKQRVLIAQALLGDPKILILDEPTNGLDPKQRVFVKQLISGFSKDRIVLIATHIVNDIDSIASDIVLMHEGQILRNDSRNKLLEELNGEIYEAQITEEEFEQFPKNCKVINWIQNQNLFFIRFHSAEQPVYAEAKPVLPSLEDVFYLTYGDTE